MRKVFVTSAIGTGLLCLAASAGAATSIEFLLTQTGRTGDVPQTAYIDDGKALIRGAGGDPNIDLLFEQATETMTIINHTDKTTLDIDAVKVGALAAQAQGMMDIVRQQVAKQMENMSEEQRKRLEEMLGNLGGATLLPAEQPKPQPRTLKSAGARTINGFRCEQVEVYAGETKVSELCAAQPEDLGIPQPDVAVIDSMKAMSDKLREQTARISEQMGQNLPQFGDSDVSGIPVRMMDQTGNSMTITAVRPGIGDVTLSKPAGYSEKQLPSLPQLTQ